MTVITTTPTFVETPVMGISSSTLEEDGQYLRVTLDKSENFKVSAGKRLKEMLENKYGGDREALKEWYKENVERWEGEYFQHRAWETVRKYLGTVIKHGDDAEQVFRDRTRRDREYVRMPRAASNSTREQNQGLTGKSTLPPRETLKPYAPPQPPTDQEFKAEQVRESIERQTTHGADVSSTSPPSGPVTTENADAQLEELVMSYFDLPREGQDEFLKRIGAVRLHEKVA